MEGLSNAGGAAVEVKVGPPERQEFTLAHPGSERERVERLVPIPCPSNPDLTRSASGLVDRGEPIFESDLAYLERHGLMTREERAVLAQLRDENTARPDHLREHPDALGITTMRRMDFEAFERTPAA